MKGNEMKFITNWFALFAMGTSGSAFAAADLVDIKWTADTFAHKAGIAPKQFLEVCGKLKAGDRVAWQFKASGSSDFNIHYHVGAEVSYPEDRKDITGADGVLSVPMDQDYCWMWSNRSARSIDIEVNLRQAKTAN
jgi:hypothetical protein